MKFVGEIGINRTEYLYDLHYSDILQIERGHERRHRHLWSATRWETYYIMQAFAGSDAMKKSGIHSPKDLMPLPWDKSEADDDGDPGDIPNEAEVERLRQLMREENAAAGVSEK